MPADSGDWRQPQLPAADTTTLMSGDIDLSVVMVSHNVAHLLGDCLESVFKECTSLQTEIFVVDSGSTDGTVELLRHRFPAVHLYASRENLGFSASNNLALPKCRGRYIVLLNPDTIVQDGGLRGLVRYLDEHASVGAVGPTLRFPHGEIQAECARNLPKLSNLLPWLLLLDKLEWRLRYRGGYRKSAAHPLRGTILDRFNLLSWSREQTCEVECISGACLMVRRQVVQQIGFLDEASPFYLDDIDYCRRVSEAGWAIHYVAGPTVTHLWQQSSSRLDRSGDFYAMACHAIWLYLRKHEGRAASMVFALMACVASLLRIPVCLAALAVPGWTRRRFWKYQLNMALGLGRWAFRWPKAAPRFGFVSESCAGTGAPERFRGGGS